MPAIFEASATFIPLLQAYINDPLFGVEYDAGATIDVAHDSQSM